MRTDKKVKKLTAVSLKSYSDPTMWEMTRSSVIFEASMMTCAHSAILPVCEQVIDHDDFGGWNEKLERLRSEVVELLQNLDRQTCGLTHPTQANARCLPRSDLSVLQIERIPRQEGSLAAICICYNCLVVWTLVTIEHATSKTCS